MILPGKRKTNDQNGYGKPLQRNNLYRLIKPPLFLPCKRAQTSNPASQVKAVKTQTIPQGSIKPELRTLHFYNSNTCLQNQFSPLSFHIG